MKFSVVCLMQKSLSGLSSVLTSSSLCGCWTELPSGGNLQPVSLLLMGLLKHLLKNSLSLELVRVTVIIFHSSTSFAISFSGGASLPFRAADKPHCQSELHKAHYSASTWVSVPFAFLAVTVLLLFSSWSSFVAVFLPHTVICSEFPLKITWCCFSSSWMTQVTAALL